MSRVVVVGSANVDFTVRLPRLPTQGETVSEGQFYMSFGGKGANQALACFRAGAEVALVAKIGMDSLGKALKDHLAVCGVGAHHIMEEEGASTGTALIMVDSEGRNIIGVAPGANRLLRPEDVRGRRELFAWGKVLLVQLEVPLETTWEALVLAKEHSMTTLLNPAPWREIPKEVMELVDIVTPNGGEARRLSGCEGGQWEEVGRAILSMGPKKVVITLGEKGALALDQEGFFYCEGLRVKAVDTTGCGDAFNGALACALAKGFSWKEAVAFANCAGALAATRKGAQDSMPWRDEIVSLLGQMEKSFS